MFRKILAAVLLAVALAAGVGAIPSLLENVAVACSQADC
jgi:hypothetical protein